jgi:hypothetical protein
MERAAEGAGGARVVAGGESRRFCAGSGHSLAPRRSPQTDPLRSVLVIEALLESGQHAGEAPSVTIEGGFRSFEAVPLGGGTGGERTLRLGIGYWRPRNPAYFFGG